MNQKERMAIQRVMAHEAIAKLRGIEEFFGVENDTFNTSDYSVFSKRIDELESWLFDESPIA